MNGNPYHWGQTPGHYDGYQQSHYDPRLKHQTLMTVQPFVQYGLDEAKKTSYRHAMMEVAAISYLIGRGYPPRMAYQMVESWEVNEHF
ncbi:hypothetical protein [Bacillus sp. Marseille-Q3570]|uniref:hypothetical protein n=1 Tax=Bacillus sp. Marseille-Q3570 TaxID=2963522 RepID=UPI0021B74906|nr:hypothetical protein [Bacillus sp. Marseille-Q3570]